jgi:hypothetical protein
MEMTSFKTIFLNGKRIINWLILAGRRQMQALGWQPTA